MTYLVESNDTTTFSGCSCQCWLNFGELEIEPPKPCLKNGCPSHCWAQLCSPRMDPASLE